MESRCAADSYLRALWILREKYFCVRAVDIAHFLECSKPSVSMAFKQLISAGLARCDADGALSLTPAGAARAQRIHDRCLFLQDWLIETGADPAQARREACAMEPAISEGTFDCIRAYLDRARKARV